MILSFLIIVVFVKLTPISQGSLSNVNVEKFGDFQLDISKELFTNDGDSTIFMTVDDNEWVYRSQDNEKLETGLYFSHPAKVVKVGDYCYVVDAHVGFQIIDMTDLDFWEVVGSIRLDHADTDDYHVNFEPNFQIVVDNNYAHVIYYEFYFIINIESKMNPYVYFEKEFLVDFSSSNCDMAIDTVRNVAFLCSYDGVEVYEYGGDEPTKRHEFGADLCFRTVLHPTERVLYTMSLGGDLTVWDVDFYSAPVQTDSFYFLAVSDWTINEQSIFALDSNGFSGDSFFRIDLTDPYSPTHDDVDDKYDLSSNCEWASLTAYTTDEFLFISCGWWGTDIYELNTTTGGVNELIHDDYIYDNVRYSYSSFVCDNSYPFKTLLFECMGTFGMVVFDITDLSPSNEPVYEYAYNDNMNNRKLECFDTVLLGDELLAVGDTHELLVLDVRNIHGEEMDIISYFYTVENAGYSDFIGMSVSGDYLYMTFEDGNDFLLSIIDWTDITFPEIYPHNPGYHDIVGYDYCLKTYYMLIRDDEVDVMTKPMIIHDSQYAIIGGKNVILFVDIDNKTDCGREWLLEDGKIEVELEFVYDVMVVDDEEEYIYFFSNPDIEIWDISKMWKDDTKAVREMEKNERLVYNPHCATISGDTMFVCYEEGGVKIFDISNRTHVEYISYIPADLALQVFVDDTMAYVSDQNIGIHLVDINDLSNPKPLSVIEECRNVQSVKVRDNILYVADGLLGVKVYSLDILLRGSDQFSYFCGTTGVTVRAEDGTGQGKSLFDVTKESFCDEGTCQENFKCDCNVGYSGDLCDSWMCYDVDFKSVGSVCNGHGHCVSYDECDCYGGYASEDCSLNTLYFSVMTPILTVSSVTAGSIVLFMICAACVCCCLCLTVLFFCVLCCSAVVLRQLLRLRKYGMLRDFDILLQEQIVDDDTSVAHIRINQSLFEVPYEEVKTVSILGEGGSNSVVFKALWHGRTVAFKVFKTRTLMNSQEKFDEFEREVEILGSLSHPNVIRFFGATMNPPRIGILMEYASKGEILEFFKEFKEESGSEYPMFQKMRMFTQITSVLEFLHSRNIIHRDIKSENILISESEDTKLMDFGLSRVANVGSNMTKRVGTDVYMSPEIVTTDFYSEKCDVFSFSILLYILLTENGQPYGMNNFQVEIKVANDSNYRPKLEELEKVKFDEDEDKDSGFRQWFCNIIQKCWDADPEERFSFKQLREMFMKKSEGKMTVLDGSLRFNSMERPKKKKNKEDEDNDEGDKHLMEKYGKFSRLELVRMIEGSRNEEVTSPFHLPQTEEEKEDLEEKEEEEGIIMEEEEVVEEKEDEEEEKEEEEEDLDEEKEKEEVEKEGEEEMEEKEEEEKSATSDHTQSPSSGEDEEEEKEENEQGEEGSSSAAKTQSEEEEEESVDEDSSESSD